MPNDLKEYVSNVKDLEISLYKQGLLLQNLEAQVSYLQHPYQHKNFPPAEGRENGIGIAMKYMAAGGVLGLLLCFIIGISDAGLLKAIWVFGIIAGGLAFGFLIYMILRITDARETKKWQQEISEKNRIIALQNKKIIQMSKEQLQIINPQYRKAEQLYSQTKAALERYYRKGVIFEKYRSIVPVCMFHEYLLSGRCSVLEGQEGAYQIYEKELRANVISGNLKDIIKRVEAIENNQCIIAAAIKETNDQIQQLCSRLQCGLHKLENIEESAELIAYYHEAALLNKTCLAWLDSGSK